MPWSWKLGRVAGIAVYVHATFFMLLAWIALSYWLARLERMPDVPIQELWVALAGPAVNVVIALVLFGWLHASGAWQSITRVGVATGAFAERVMLANVVLGVFNLPAFPMDGGRALRALLATRMEYTRATQRAAAIGQGMAVLLGFIGLQGNRMLIFIALFVWIGAGQEASMVQMKSALAGIPLRRAMLTHFRALTPTSTLGDAIDLLLTGSQQDFPVVVNGRVEGMLTRSDLVKALTRSGRDASVRDVMTRECFAADASKCSKRCSGVCRGGTAIRYRCSSWCVDRFRHHGQCWRVPDDSGRGTGTFIVSRGEGPARTTHAGVFRFHRSHPIRRHVEGVATRLAESIRTLGSS
jgi:Zn-dependent protease